MESENINDIFNKPSAYGCSMNEVMLLFGTVVLLLILLAEFFDFGNFIQPYAVVKPRPKSKSITPDASESETYDYGYEDHNGPTVWKFKFPDALGNRQSPININCKNALVCPISPLSWSCEYTVVPSRIRVYNDGHCVNLQARFIDIRPSISGGPLKAKYELFSIRFRWGPTDDEGSEHTIDLRRFAMEMQAIHVKRGFNCDNVDTTMTCDGSDSVIVISYVFQVTTIDNPYLEPILGKLEHIKYPGYSTLISSFPICWLMPTFVSDYYMYQGSLTYPPCTEGIQWIVQPEPLAVSPRQVRKFRKLVTKRDGKILTNARPIQCLNNREVFYFTSNDDYKK